MGLGVALGGLGLGVALGDLGLGVALGGFGLGVALGGFGLGVALGGSGLGVALGGFGLGVALGGFGLGVALGDLGLGVALGGLGHGVLGAGAACGGGVCWENASEAGCFADSAGLTASHRAVPKPSSLASGAPPPPPPELGDRTTAEKLAGNTEARGNDDGSSTTFGVHDKRAAGELAALTSAAASGLSGSNWPV